MLNKIIQHANVSNETFAQLIFVSVAQLNVWLSGAAEVPERIIERARILTNHPDSKLKRQCQLLRN